MFNFIARIFSGILGTHNERSIKKISPLVKEINALEEKFTSFSDEEIRGHFESIKQKVLENKKQIEEEVVSVREAIRTSSSDTERNKRKKQLINIKNGILEEYLPEVFAIVREVSKRTIGLRHFDVQMVGGIVLHQGKISEMATGEGKTLVAPLAACLNALTGEGVHIITVNDYLAKRDSEWMGPIYKFLGLTVGLIQNDISPNERKKSYQADIAYGTNNEFGFDYLRDNMVHDTDLIVQRNFAYAIIDEVDSILIDEARTPLIISGPIDETNEAYNNMRPIIQKLVAYQKTLVNKYLEEFKRGLKEEKKENLEELLYLIHKADPKNREFLDLVLKNPEAKKILDRAQGTYDSKSMEKDRDVLLESLYYVFDEKTREATFSALGQNAMKKEFDIDFMLEDIETSLSMLAKEEMDDAQRLKKETELITEYSEKQKIVDSVKQLLKAYILFEKDVDYVVNDNKIVIVDSFTGRMMPGRRFSDGIHEAIEAKERVEVQRESQTLATITLQNYFRMYDKLSGMTGTAKTEEAEFENIYLLSVIQIPTNRELKRISFPDRIYKTEKEKFNAAADEVEELNSKGSPVLVGTVSIEKSEKLGKILNSRGVKHNILNAKYHEREAHIIAQAGRFGAVTIATNMAGRGTDILLGGNPEFLANDALDKIEIDDPKEREKAYQKFLESYTKEISQEKEKVIASGGLYVMGTERHESRRIDNQLKGRSGRQGDAGSSRFYLSLEDDLMRIFGADRIKMVMDRLGMEEGEVIENPLVTRSVRTAQSRVETQNFEIRKHLLKYDNVMNQQREVIYRRRRMVLKGEELKEEFFECLDVGVESILETWNDFPEVEEVSKKLMYKYGININQDELDGRDAATIREMAIDNARKSYELRRKIIGEEKSKNLEKMVMLTTIDSNWKEYLREIDELREGISWRAYAQKDPLVEFQHEAFKMFSDLMIKVDEEIAEKIVKISAMEEKYNSGIRNRPIQEKFEHRSFSVTGEGDSMGQTIENEQNDQSSNMSMMMPKIKKEDTYKRDLPKVGRNDSCSCGSGKKFKKCCGK